MERPPQGESPSYPIRASESASVTLFVFWEFNAGESVSASVNTPDPIIAGANRDFFSFVHETTWMGRRV